MATAVLRCPLLASPLPAGGGAAASCSGSSRPTRFLLRRRRCPSPLLAVSSDSSKPLASSSTGGGGDPDEEPVLPLLQELADCLVLPPKFLSLLPRDLRLDLNDAAFDLSNGPVLNECGQEVGDLLLDLGKAWEMANTEASNNLAKQLPSMAPYLTASAKSAFGKRLASAGKKFQTMGQYGNGEFKKISETMIKIGKVLSKRPVIQAEVEATKEKRKLKFAGAEFELTAQNAYIGAAVGLVFGFFSWQLAQGVQSSPDDSQFFFFFLMQPLKVPLLLLGYTSTALSAAAAVGLVVLALQMNPEDKSD
ncbi:uncharacterized protein LOC125515414 isoform X1 [Triticum urartu]|uniref:uncharacterized protein LOC119318495 isoform X1 n=1 Tax=Triticum dicoccoides TaxID=85692 RepID=UPI00084448F9|nr:uncharacterized protein LOC119318495 isoform X1 [Triticum dicoccoides]XP_044405014.1 uncharacterized protein LOC123128956 isoform X1 [Triticum aestivum]XP_048536805.1 uncharacterized protein LOC125515384 isoform X1 [Triticum urartu]XP_048536839.1 uncharacterized protein LOC125515414 isoform X1 [Triticum urartu]